MRALVRFLPRTYGPERGPKVLWQFLLDDVVVSQAQAENTDDAWLQVTAYLRGYREARQSDWWAVVLFQEDDDAVRAP